MAISNLKFEIQKTLPNGLGRTGIIHTPHGDIKTPAFIAVGTQGYVKFITPDELKSIRVQTMLSNGYHLRAKSAEIAKQGGLANFSRWNGPTITDSGGFQVMSLGSGLGKVVAMNKITERTNTHKSERLAQVTDNGVHFVDPFTKQSDFISPEESMQIQCRIGADIHMAFDELTSLADTYEYNVQALRRTEQWAERSLREHLKHRDDLGYRQSLYAVLQGGRWEELRRSTARTLANMQIDNQKFDGFGLGGAFLKEDLGNILKWCNEELPPNKPRHLLGLSHPDDIFIGTEMGADTFDCVAPTREARHGKIYTLDGPINLRKFHDSPQPLDDDCDCPTCQQGYTRGQLRALWHSGDRLKKQQFFTLASLHNLRFIIRLTEQIRMSIEQGSFYEFKEKFLLRFYN